MKKLMSISILIFLWAGQLSGQETRTDVRGLFNHESEGFGTLVMYPESVRRAFLEVSLHPEALIRLEEIQQGTRDAFLEIVAPYNRDVQAEFYELSRYPDLINALVIGGKKKKAEIKLILEAYPIEIHEIALNLGRKRFNDLSEIHALNEVSYHKLSDLMQQYPAHLAGSLNILMDRPEVLEILIGNLRSTIMLGSYYREFPNLVWSEMNTLQEEFVSNRLKEQEDWKASMENDRQAKKELQQAAEDFAYENNILLVHRNVYYDWGSFSWYHHPFISYSFWYGYPWWYQYPIWYPETYWYSWGIYEVGLYQIVILDLPVWFYMDWYFARTWHHYYYPHLSHRYLRHYEDHQHSTLAPTRVINNWVSQNHDVYVRDLQGSQDNRVERLRDLGRRSAEYREVAPAREARRYDPVYEDRGDRDAREPVFRNPESQPADRKPRIERVEPQRKRTPVIRQRQIEKPSRGVIRENKKPAAVPERNLKRENIIRKN